MKIKPTNLFLLSALILSVAWIQPAEAKGGRKYGWRYVYKKVKRAQKKGLEIRPREEVFSLDDDLTFWVKTYADGSEWRATETKEEIDGDIRHNLRTEWRQIDPRDNPEGTFTGLCDELWRLEVVGKGYVMDEPGRHRLKVIAAIEGENVELVEWKRSKDESTEWQCHEGYAPGDLAAYPVGLLNYILEKADEDENKIVTSFELAVYDAQVAIERFNP